MKFETILPTSGKWWILAQEQENIDDIVETRYAFAKKILSQVI
jgi:hypothetical protein